MVNKRSLTLKVQKNKYGICLLHAICWRKIFYWYIFQPEEFILRQCSLYAVILQSATLATLLNFELIYSKLIWVVTFRQVTFPEYYGFSEQQIYKCYGIKKCNGGKSKLMNFFKSLRKNPSRIPFVINLRKFRARRLWKVSYISYLDESFPNSYHQKTIKAVRNSTTCNFRITDPMTINIWVY